MTDTTVNAQLYTTLHCEIQYKQSERLINQFQYVDTI